MHINKTYEFDLDTGTRQYKTWVFSSDGLDLIKRFDKYKITNIKEIPNPSRKVDNDIS